MAVPCAFILRREKRSREGPSQYGFSCIEHNTEHDIERRGKGRTNADEARRSERGRHMRGGGDAQCPMPDARCQKVSFRQELLLQKKNVKLSGGPWFEALVRHDWLRSRQLQLQAGPRGGWVLVNPGPPCYLRKWNPKDRRVN